MTDSKDHPERDGAARAHKTTSSKRDLTESTFSAAAGLGRSAQLAPSLSYARVYTLVKDERGRSALCKPDDAADLQARRATRSRPRICLSVLSCGTRQQFSALREAEGVRGGCNCGVEKCRSGFSAGDDVFTPVLSVALESRSATQKLPSLSLSSCVSYGR